MNIERNSGENIFDYAKRLVNNKAMYDLNNQEIYDLLFDKGLAKDECRKRLYGINDLLEEMEKEAVSHLPKSHLKKYKEIVSEYDEKKRISQIQLNNIRKLKRELVPIAAVIEGMREIYMEEDFKVIIPEYTHEYYKTDNVAILQISDWHIGYVINNCKGNYFNLEIAKERIRNLLSEVVNVVQENKISKLYVINTGDMIEHTYMRKNQNDFTEFPLSRQIVETSRLIFGMLISLSGYCKVEYDSLAGNHDRMSGDKQATLDGDNANYIINGTLQDYVEIASNQLNGKLVINNPGHNDEIIKVIGGLKVKAIHGDGKTNNASKLMKDEISMDNEFYDILLKGHLHNFNIVSENQGRYIISCGCLSGYNDYSTKFGCATLASQTMIVLEKNKIKFIKDIQL